MTRGWDCHAHLFGPYDRFPLAADRSYTPPEAVASQYLSLLSRLGLSNGVLVHPSAYGDDFSLLFDALSRNANLRGVIVVRPGTLATLDGLRDKGIRATRFSQRSGAGANFAGSASFDDLLALAPALAAAGLVPRPHGEKKAPGGRPIVLMSTAEGLKDGFANDAGRNSIGAMLAPGFYPDAADPVARTFVERFTLAHGHAPGAIDAYAFDAAQLVAATGAGSRSQVADGLPGMRLAGVTGELAFDANHRRSDDGVIYTVAPADDGSGFQIRVLGE